MINPRAYPPGVEAYLKSKGVVEDTSRRYNWTAPPGVNTPLVTVITPHLPSRTAEIARCVESVQKQWWPSIEHLVIDDNRPVHGQSGADGKNHGQSFAKGEYITYIDDDDTMRPQHLGLLVSLLTATPEARWAYAAVAWHRGDGVRYTYSTVPEPGNFAGSFFMHHRSVMVEWVEDHRDDWLATKSLIDAGYPYISVNAVTADHH